MRNFRIEFENRSKEVERYLYTLKTMQRCLSERQLRRRELESKILIGGALVIIYNVIEAGARNSIEAIYDEIQGNGVQFQALRETIRCRIISDFKKNASPKRHNMMQDVAMEIVSAGFLSGKLFSGNVDAKKIREVSADFGFNIDTDYEKTRHGEELIKIKNKRNDLAHGIISFSEAGREYTLEEMLDVWKYAHGYMSEIQQNIDRYLDNEDYLESAVVA